VLVQLPERCRADSKVKAAGFPTISSFAAERVRRSSRGLSDKAEIRNGGFRLLRLAASCFRSWDGSDPGQLGTLLDRIGSHAEHLVKGATTYDILTELLLKDGFPLSVKVSTVRLAGKEVFSIADGALLVCLDNQLTQEVIDAMADMEPSRVICLDAGFQGNDQLKANAVQTFKARARNRETAIEFRTV